MGKRTLIETWTTEAGLKASIFECSWGNFRDAVLLGFPPSWHCGYVSVKGIKELEGVDYLDVEDDYLCHGGLTFSDYIEDEWCFGFDTGHGDVVSLEEVKADCESLATQFKEET